MKRPKKNTAAAEATTRIEDAPIVLPNRDSFGQYRRAQRLPDGVEDFILTTDKDGMRVVDRYSNDTATVIHHDGPLLEKNIRDALQFCQRAPSLGQMVNPKTIANKYPEIGKWFDEPRINQLIGSKLGDINPHKEAIYAIAQTLQRNPNTVARDWGNPSKPGKSAVETAEPIKRNVRRPTRSKRMSKPSKSK